MKDADLYTIEQIGIPSLVLMERAALQIVETMEQEHTDLRKSLIVCGSGNNEATDLRGKAAHGKRA